MTERRRTPLTAPLSPSGAIDGTVLTCAAWSRPVLASCIACMAPARSAATRRPPTLTMEEQQFCVDPHTGKEGCKIFRDGSCTLKTEPLRVATNTLSPSDDSSMHAGMAGKPCIHPQNLRNALKARGSSLGPGSCVTHATARTFRLSRGGTLGRPCLQAPWLLNLFHCYVTSFSTPMQYLQISILFSACFPAAPARCKNATAAG